MKYRDADRARRFLTEVVGFTETLTVRDDDGHRIVHGELTWPEGGGVMYGTVGESGAPKDAAEPVPGHQWVYVVTADPDAVLKRVAGSDGRALTGPVDTDYGSRNVTLADTEGNTWTFGTYPGA